MIKNVYHIVKVDIFIHNLFLFIICQYNIYMKNSGPIVFLTLVIFISLVISPRPIIEGRGKSG